jgi:glucose dehydrogenase
VKPETGKLVWYFQETPGDDWDYTSTQPIVLADLTIDGRKRKVLLHAPKNGFFYVLDRVTGEFISGAKYARRVTWASGLDAKGRPIEAKGARYGVNPVLISPGNGGAHNWEAMAYSPLTELAYIPGTEGGARYARDPKFVYTPGSQNAGMSTMQRPRDANGNVIPPDPPNVPVVEPEGAENEPKAAGGFLLAWDPKANKEKWRVPAVGGYLRGGATLATAGNLVFHDSKAYNAETGDKLWDIELSGEVVAPVTYMLDGKQYVTYFARTYPNSRLFSFVLDGKEPIPPLPPKE